MSEVLKLEHIQKYYGSKGNVTKAIQDISFSVQEGEFVGIMGASGSGKTTLLNCISTIDTISAGKILLDGVNIADLCERDLAKFRRERLGFVFQDFMLLDGLTVRENVLVPRIIKDRVEPEAEQLADALLSLFGIAHITDKYPAEISGGERQRTAVARSLINKPLIILADEPTGNLDSKSSRTVIEAFENARQQLGATIFMVTHDSYAASFCDRVILLKDGVVYNTLQKQEDRKESQGAFQDRLLIEIKEMSSV